MTKLIKYSVSAVAAIIILFIAGGIAIKHFINTEMLKNTIVNEIHDKTGRELRIQDGIKISFFPSLNLEIQHATLSNPSNFTKNKPFADIGNLKVSIAVLPLLLQNRIVLNEIIVKESTFNLITLANGETNWKDFSNKGLNQPKVTKTIAQQKTKNENNIQFDIGELIVNNSSINWDNQQRNHHWQITHFNADGSNISLDHAFPLKMNGQYNEAQGAPSSWDVDAQIKIDPSQQIYILKPFKFNASIEGIGPVSVSFSELEISEADQIIALKDSVFSGANIHGKGNLNISSYKKNPRAKGQFTFDSLELGQFKITNLNVPISSQNGIYVSDPITSKLYGGTFSGKATLNTNGNIPQWHLDYKLSNIELQRLLADTGSSNKFSGILQSNGQLSAQGFNEDSIKLSLSGPAHFKIDNGVYTGLDLAYWWQIGKELMQTAATATIPTVGTVTDIANVINIAKYKNTNQTAFTDISADFTFQNGVGTTNNFVLYNDIIYVKAQGTIDVNKKFVDMKLLISQSSGSAATGTAIPFTLKGNFDKLTVTPDVAAFPTILKSTAKGVVSFTEKAPESLKKPIQQIGNALGGLLSK